MVTTSFLVGRGMGPETVAPVLCALVDQLMVIGLQADPNHFVLCHVAVFLLKNIRSVIVFATLRTVENPIHLTVRITP